ncbi:MAG: acetylxylan esterase [Victivallales bacterium]|jgi:cephalosporin-C deacetylase-like acetyl esterase
MNRKILMALAVAALGFGVAAMNLNVPAPYGDKCSPPQKPELAFYSAQSEDLLFENGKEIEIICQAGLRGVGMKWTLHRNMVQKEFRSGKADPLPPNRFKIRIDTADLQPGFYDIRVLLDTGAENTDKNIKRPLDGVCVFGWKVSEMPIRDTRPSDFRAFWDKAMADYSAIPLDAKIEDEVKIFKGKEINEYNLKYACLPGDYDPEGHRCEEVESYKISFAGPDGGRVYAWLAKPLGKGPFPAMLVLPGAGFGARPRPLEHARHGYLAVDVQIHGQDVDQPKYEKIPGYNDNWVYEPVDKFYFKNVYLRAARAVEYLCSLPEVDRKRIVTVGGSQGGRLSIIVPSLDKRVKATVPCIANSPNYPQLRWVARCNGCTRLFGDWKDPGFNDGVKTNGADLKGAPPVVDDPEWRCWAYYDPMNFAPDVSCPAFFNAGLVDPVSPPTSIWASYKRLSSKDKTVVALPGLGHDWSAEFDRRAWRWLDKVLVP